MAVLSRGEVSRSGELREENENIFRLNQIMAINESKIADFESKVNSWTAGLRGWSFPSPRRRGSPCLQFLGQIVLLGTGIFCGNAGTIETLDHRMLEGNISLTEEGRLELTSVEGKRQEFPLDTIRVARLH